MPRFGFAYRPFDNDKWAIRGGVGIYNINMLGSSFYSLTGTVQAQTQNFTNSYNSNTHAIGYRWPAIDPGSGGNGRTTAMAATTSAPPTVPTGKIPTRSNGRWAWNTILARLRGPHLLYRLRDASTGLGSGREYASLLDHGLGI